MTCNDSCALTCNAVALQLCGPLANALFSTATQAENFYGEDGALLQSGRGPASSRPLAQLLQEPADSELMGLLQSILDTDPTTRATAKQARQHQWFGRGRSASLDSIGSVGSDSHWCRECGGASTLVKPHVATLAHLVEAQAVLRKDAAICLRSLQHMSWHKALDPIVIVDRARRAMPGLPETAAMARILGVIHVVQACFHRDQMRGVQRAVYIWMLNMQSAIAAMQLMRQVQHAQHSQSMLRGARRQLIANMIKS